MADCFPICVGVALLPIGSSRDSVGRQSFLPRRCDAVVADHALDRSIERFFFSEREFAALQSNPALAPRRAHQRHQPPRRDRQVADAHAKRRERVLDRRRDRSRRRNGAALGRALTPSGLSSVGDAM